MSALQQARICGLEEPEFPCRGEACQGHRDAEQGPAKPGSVIPWRLAQTLGLRAD
jgi:hypothetical protein